MFKYLRYFGTHVLVWSATIGFLAGGSWYWLGLAVGVVGWMGGDALSLKLDPEPPIYKRRYVLDLACYSLFPSLVLMCVVFAWALSPGDLLGIGALVETRFGGNTLAAKAAATPSDYWGASYSYGLAIAMGGILTAHELTHRTSDGLAMWLGRWMLAMAFNASLATAHVFGHHLDVATPADPATARRGESIYYFFMRSTVGQVFQAWRIESERLRALGASNIYLQNRVFHGFLRSGLVAGLFFAAGGWLALGIFLLAAVWSKLLLESLNYMEHYGLVREPGSPIEARHSWDSDRAFCQAALFNLPYHADHHHRAGVQYPELVRDETAPQLAQGYLATVPIVLMPPLWQRLMAPKLEEWDRDRASDAERALVG
jgi:alkane 1-monooxygenase